MASSPMDTFTPAMFDAMRRIHAGHVTAKDIGLPGNTLSALADRGFLKIERTSRSTYYEPTAMGLGAIAVITAPFIPPVNTEGRVARIQRTVAEYYGIPVIEMTSDRRPRDIARARQIAMYLVRELTTFSLPRIGHMFGGRDHTTVMYAIRKIAELDEEDPEISADINVLLTELEPLRMAA
jgi:hypothetical protein